MPCISLCLCLLPPFTSSLYMTLSPSHSRFTLEFLSFFISPLFFLLLCPLLPFTLSIFLCLGLPLTLSLSLLSYLFLSISEPFSYFLFLSSSLPFFLSLFLFLCPFFFLLSLTLSLVSFFPCLYFCSFFLSKICLS
jgi:hypothetical protein